MVHCSRWHLQRLGAERKRIDQPYLPRQWSKHRVFLHTAIAHVGLILLILHERERERQTDRQTHRDGDREIDRERERER